MSEVKCKNFMGEFKAKVALEAILRFAIQLASHQHEVFYARINDQARLIHSFLKTRPFRFSHRRETIFNLKVTFWWKR